MWASQDRQRLLTTNRTNRRVFFCVFESCCDCFVFISTTSVCLSVGCVGAGACGAGGQPAAEGSGGREAAGAGESPTGWRWHQQSRQQHADGWKQVEPEGSVYLRQEIIFSIKQSDVLSIKCQNKVKNVDQCFQSQRWHPQMSCFVHKPKISSSVSQERKETRKLIQLEKMKCYFKKQC